MLDQDLSLEESRILDGINLQIDNFRASGFLQNHENHEFHENHEHHENHDNPENRENPGNLRNRQNPMQTPRHTLDDPDFDMGIESDSLSD